MNLGKLQVRCIIESIAAEGDTVTTTFVKNHAHPILSINVWFDAVMHTGDSMSVSVVVRVLNAHPVDHSSNDRCLIALLKIRRLDVEPGHHLIPYV